MLPWGVMWRAALRAGVGPGEFWGLSVREWRWLAGDGAGGMSGARLAEMMGRFPDEGPLDPHPASPLQGEESLSGAPISPHSVDCSSPCKGEVRWGSDGGEE